MARKFSWLDSLSGMGDKKRQEEMGPLKKMRPNRYPKRVWKKDEPIPLRSKMGSFFSRFK